MLTGIILAGGQNTRMQGRNKALLTYQGEPFIVRQVRELQTLCSSVIVVTNNPAPYLERLPPDILYIPDVYAGHGPLSGFHAAFLNVETDYAWVVSCDSPDISAPAAAWMLTRLEAGGYDAVLPVIDGKHQMLHGVYRPHRILPDITARLANREYRLGGLLESLHWLGVEREDLAGAGLKEDFAADIDTPEQYEQLLHHSKGSEEMGDSLFEITESVIIPAKVSDKVLRREAGAITLFIGTVREFTQGKKTLYLEYEAYPSMAVTQLKRIGQEVLERWPDTKVAVTHRIGRLEITDIAVVIAVSSPHRKAAYEANEYVIERIKQIVPIWKKEMGEDGEAWIGDQLGQQTYPKGRPDLPDIPAEDQR